MFNISVSTFLLAGQTGAASSNVSGLSGTINFADTMPSSTGTAMASLSTAMASAENQLSSLQQKQFQLIKLQQQKAKLEQKLAETSKNTITTNMSSFGNSSLPYTSELFPPTPKNTPFFMTPPVTPPNESYHNIFVGDASKPPTGKEKVCYPVSVKEVVNISVKDHFNSMIGVIYICKL